MRNVIRCGTLVIALALPAPAVAQQATDDAVRARVEALLSAYEATPPADAFTSLGSEGRDALLAIAADVRAAPFARGRAAWALQHFPEEPVREALERLLSESDLPDVILRRAIESLAVFGEREVSVVAPYLEDRRLEVRETAARSLARIGGSAVLRAFRRRIDREPDEAFEAWLRAEADRIETALRNR
jgi:HEAT repeat protein